LIIKEGKGIRVTAAIHSNEVRPRKDHRGFDLISDALPSMSDFREWG
jgi:hypothetical protein